MVVTIMHFHLFLRIFPNNFPLATLVLRSFQKVSPIVLDLEDQLRQSLHRGVIDSSDLAPDLVEQLFTQATFPPGVDIDARGCEQGLRKVRDGPAAVLVTVAQDLPVAGRDLQQAAAAPAVRGDGLGVRGVDALDALALVRVQRLVLDQVVQHVRVVLQRRVRDGHVAVRLPHRQRRVRDVPHPLQERHRRRCELLRRVFDFRL